MATSKQIEKMKLSTHYYYYFLDYIFFAIKYNMQLMSSATNQSKSNRVKLELDGYFDYCATKKLYSLFCVLSRNIIYVEFCHWLLYASFFNGVSYKKFHRKLTKSNENFALFKLKFQGPNKLRKLTIQELYSLDFSRHFYCHSQWVSENSIIDDSQFI